MNHSQAAARHRAKDTDSELAEWLDEEASRLIDWARLSRQHVAFGYLDSEGVVQSDEDLSLLITARMSYVFALAALHGDSEAINDAAHGMAALAPGGSWDVRENGRPFWDLTNGGWNSQAAADASAVTPSTKSAYDHAFVLLSAATAHLAEIPGSETVLKAAASIVLERFWSDSEGALIDSFSPDWLVAEDYRGANANMHFVEACLATAAATDDESWLDRALLIADRLINVNARGNAWRILEHFDGAWNPLPDYNLSNPADRFRPYGYLVGHSFEWARLLLHLEVALRERGRTVEWLTEASSQLWLAAVHTAWEVDGEPGLLYSLDWDDRPVISLRLHWVIAEAIGAAWALHSATGERCYLEWHERLWVLVRGRFVDKNHRSWHHELTPAGEPSATIWPGKPDVYHALNAVLLPLGEFASTPAAGIRTAR